MSDPSEFNLAQSLYEAGLVILGGCISLGAALAVSLRQEQVAKKEHRRFVANALVRKVWQATDEVLRFERDIAAMIAVAEVEPDEENIWLYIMPIFGFEVSGINLGEDEFILLQDVGENEAYSYFVQILNYRESLLRSVQTYSEFRNELQKKLSRYSVAKEEQGQPVVSFAFDVRENPDLHIEMLSARAQAIDLRKISLEYSVKAREAIKKLRVIVEKNEKRWARPMIIELVDAG